MRCPIARLFRNVVFDSHSHAVLEEVRNSTGYGGRRAIDILVIELFPSHGNHIHAIEVKSSGSDLRRELNDPDKSETIGRFCDTFSVALVGGVRVPEDLPDDWGIWRVEGQRVTREREPRQRRNVWPPTREFIAAIARAVAKDVHEQTAASGHNEGG